MKTDSKLIYKAGRPMTYDSSKLETILASVKKARGSFGQVADLIGVPRDTFYNWVRRGEEDRNNGENSEIAQFCSKIRKEQAEVVIKLCESALKDPKKANYIMWWLSKICREDFANDGYEYKELLAMYMQLRDDFKRLKEGQPLQGAMKNGKEMDSKSN